MHVGEPAAPLQSLRDIPKGIRQTFISKPGDVRVIDIDKGDSTIL
jgi:hypothetical protein